jgi:hypothetical protein
MLDVSGFYIFLLFSRVFFFFSFYFSSDGLVGGSSLTSSVSFSDGWLRLRDTRSIPPSLVQQSVSSSACPARQGTSMLWMVKSCVCCVYFFFYITSFF